MRPTFGLREKLSTFWFISTFACNCLLFKIIISSPKKDFCTHFEYQSQLMIWPIMWSITWSLTFSLTILNILFLYITSIWLVDLLSHISWLFYICVILYITHNILIKYPHLTLLFVMQKFIKKAFNQWFYTKIWSFINISS